MNAWGLKAGGSAPDISATYKGPPSVRRLASESRQESEASRFLLGRSAMDPSPDEEDVLGFHRFIGKAFIDAPMVAYPHLDRKEFAWRSHVFTAP